MQHASAICHFLFIFSASFYALLPIKPNVARSHVTLLIWNVWKQNQSVHVRWPVAFARGAESCGRTNEIASTTSKENLSKDFICCFLATSWKNIFHPAPHSASAERRKNIFVFPIHPQLFSFRAITRRNKPQHIDSESKKAMHTKGWKNPVESNKVG